MAHQLEIVNGNAQTFYVGDAPWHQLGTKLMTPPTVQEAIVVAGLNWEVRRKAIQTIDGERLDHFATYRTNDNKILGVVGPRYEPLQNLNAFEFFNPFLDKGLATLETAGSLFDGRKIWVLAKIAGDPMEIVKDDIVNRYILLSNSHDGTTAIRAGFTGVRVVCNNTLTTAHTNKDSRLLRVRHSVNTLDNLTKIIEVMNAVNSTFEATATQYRYLATREVNEADLKRYVNIVFKVQNKFKELEASEEQEEEEELRVYPKIVNLFENGRGTDIKGVRGTWWNAYNAVTEYTTHQRGRNEENRLNSLWFGQSANTNKKALDTALALAA